MAFFQERDFRLFQSFNKEMINNFVETPIVIYKVNEERTEENIYGESVGGKTYDNGVKINALIQRDDYTVSYENFGSDKQQRIQVRFLKSLLEDAGIKPWEGDIISFNDAYFEIDNQNENELIAGNPDFSNSIIVDAHMKRRSSLNIEDLN